MAMRKRRKLWSGDVTKKSNALDLEKRVFTWSDPLRVARSLRNSAQRSHRRKGSPYQSAMSMLNFYINRAGRHLSRDRKRTLARRGRASKILRERESVPATSPDQTGSNLVEAFVTQNRIGRGLYQISFHVHVFVSHFDQQPLVRFGSQHEGVFAL